MSTEEIYNYRKIDDRTITGGQPTEEQLRAVAAAGFTTVINLAPIDPARSLVDEASWVGSLGMTYHHIPVKWDDPQAADFAAFEAAMQASRDEKTLIHCMANFRVTAFYGLYAMKHLGWTEAQADELRAPIWDGSDYPIWEKFIAEIRQEILGSQSA